MVLLLGVLLLVIFDDYGDVYGMFFVIISEGFFRDEFYDYVKDIRKELEKILGVVKIILFGNRDVVIEVLVDKNKLVNFGINEKMIVLVFIS